jgi:UDP-N-acetylmuramoyl-L-alanyl-D-glutamate--2,6-diaminopimelate ligase
VLEDGSTLPGSELLTTPGPVQLARTLRMLVDRGVKRVAMEVSSHALDQGRVHALRFDAALFTNLTRDHLDYHGTLEAYRGEALVRAAAAAGRLRRHQRDDPAWAGLAGEATRALSFGLSRGQMSRHGTSAHVRGRRVLRAASRGRRGQCAPAAARRLQRAERAGRGGCLHDAGLHGGAGGGAEDGAAGARPPGAHRAVPCAVLRDYAHTPDALERVLETLRPLTRGRIITSSARAATVTRASVRSWAPWRSSWRTWSS